MAAIAGEPGTRERAEAIMGAVAGAVTGSARALSSKACAVDRAQAPSREVAISGSRDDPRTLELVATVHSRWLPNTVLAWGGADIALLEDRPLVGGRPAAYV